MARAASEGGSRQEEEVSRWRIGIRQGWKGVVGVRPAVRYPAARVGSEVAAGREEEGVQTLPSVRTSQR